MEVIVPGASSYVPFLTLVSIGLTAAASTLTVLWADFYDHKVITRWISLDKQFLPLWLIRLWNLPAYQILHRTILFDSNGIHSWQLLKWHSVQIWDSYYDRNCEGPKLETQLDQEVKGGGAWSLNQRNKWCYDDVTRNMPWLYNNPHVIN